MPDKPLKAWMGRDRQAQYFYDHESVAVLAFAASHRQARKLAWRVLSEFDVEWIDTSARLLDHQEQFMRHCPGRACAMLDIPEPLACKACGRWGELMTEALGGPFCPECEKFRREWMKDAGVQP